MNQRPGKYQRIENNRSSGFNQVTFFETAKELLEKEGYEDAAFYFEQMEDYLRGGKQLPVDAKEISRALGL